MNLNKFISNNILKEYIITVGLPKLIVRLGVYNKD